MNKAVHFGKLMIPNQPVRWLKCQQWTGENTAKHQQPVAHFHFFVTIIWWRENLGFTKNAVKSGHAPPWHPRNSSVLLADLSGDLQAQRALCCRWIPVVSCPASSTCCESQALWFSLPSNITKAVPALFSREMPHYPGHGLTKAGNWFYSREEWKKSNLLFLFSISVVFPGSCLKQLDESSVPENLESGGTSAEWLNSSAPFSLWRDGRMCLTCDGHGQS